MKRSRREHIPTTSKQTAAATIMISAAVAKRGLGRPDEDAVVSERAAVVRLCGGCEHRRGPELGVHRWRHGRGGGCCDADSALMHQEDSEN